VLTNVYSEGWAHAVERTDRETVWKRNTSAGTGRRQRHQKET